MHSNIKSVLSTSSSLQSPLEQMHSQCNYGSFLSESQIHGAMLKTMPAQSRPKGKRRCLIRAICYFQMVYIKHAEANVRCLRPLASVHIKSNCAPKEKKAYQSHLITVL